MLIDDLIEYMEGWHQPDPSADPSAKKLPQHEHILRNALVFARRQRCPAQTSQTDAPLAEALQCDAEAAALDRAIGGGGGGVDKIETAIALTTACTDGLYNTDWTNTETDNRDTRVAKAVTTLLLSLAITQFIDQQIGSPNACTSINRSLPVDAFRDIEPLVGQVVAEVDGTRKRDATIKLRRHLLHKALQHDLRTLSDIARRLQTICSKLPKQSVDKSVGNVLPEVNPQKPETRNPWIEFRMARENKIFNENSRVLAEFVLRAYIEDGGQALSAHIKGDPDTIVLNDVLYLVQNYTQKAGDVSLDVIPLIIPEKDVNEICNTLRPNKTVAAMSVVEAAGDKKAGNTAGDEPAPPAGEQASRQAAGDAPAGEQAGSTAAGDAPAPPAGEQAGSTAAAAPAAPAPPAGKAATPPAKVGGGPSDKLSRASDEQIATIRANAANVWKLLGLYEASDESAQTYDDVEIDRCTYENGDDVKKVQHGDVLVLKELSVEPSPDVIDRDAVPYVPVHVDTIACKLYFAKLEDFDYIYRNRHLIELAYRVCDSISAREERQYKVELGGPHCSDYVQEVTERLRDMYVDPDVFAGYGRVEIERTIDCIVREIVSKNLDGPTFLETDHMARNVAKNLANKDPCMSIEKLEKKQPDEKESEENEPEENEPDTATDFFDYVYGVATTRSTKSKETIEFLHFVVWVMSMERFGIAMDHASTQFDLSDTRVVASRYDDEISSLLHQVAKAREALTKQYREYLKLTSKKVRDKYVIDPENTKMMKHAIGLTLHRTKTPSMDGAFPWTNPAPQGMFTPFGYGGGGGDGGGDGGGVGAIQNQSSASASSVTNVRSKPPSAFARTAFLQLFKLARFGWQSATLHLAERFFQTRYINKVHVKFQDPPPFSRFILVFASVDASIQLAAVLVLIALLFAFKDAKDSFFIDVELLTTLLFDFLVSIAFIVAIGLVVGNLARNKKYFDYMDNGVMTIEAYGKIMLGVCAVVTNFPFYLFWY